MLDPRARRRVDERVLELETPDPRRVRRQQLEDGYGRVRQPLKPIYGFGVEGLLPMSGASGFVSGSDTAESPDGISLLK